MIFIINSAPGVGKSTLLSKLHLSMPDSFAIIDGDDLGRVIPYTNSIKWLDLIQDNMISCCNNFKAYGTGNIVLSFVFPSEERLNRLKLKLNNFGFSVCHIKLTCDNEIQKERILRRNSQKMINIENAILLNEKINQMVSDFEIDTTFKTPQEISDTLRKYILSNFAPTGD